MDTRHRPRPMAMRWSLALHVVAAAGVFGAVTWLLVTTQSSNPDIGPLTYAMSAICGAVVMRLVYVLSALRGTSGTPGGRLLATALLALSPALLLVGPSMMLAVLASIAALFLLWVPTSSAYIRATSQDATAESSNAMEDLVNSQSSGPKIPWANAMPGNPHQPGV